MGKLRHTEVKANISNLKLSPILKVQAVSGVTGSFLKRGHGTEEKGIALPASARLCCKGPRPALTEALSTHITGVTEISFKTHLTELVPTLVWTLNLV